MRQLFSHNSQQGQTIVETMVAAFVLVMGIAASVGLAAYALRATTTTSKQAVAIGLAREGIEAVKNMRDTNWLQTPLTNNCLDFYTQLSNAPCYRQWLSGTSGLPYNINASLSGANYRLSIDRTQTNGRYWKFVSASSNYGLNLDVNNPNLGFYSTGSTSVAVSNSNTKIGRRIRLEPDQSFAPFNLTYYRRVKVIVDVWWNDKNCPVSNTVPTSDACKVTLETYLTNWKNY